MGNNLVVTESDTDVVLFSIEKLSPTKYRIVPARANKHFQVGSVYETVIICKGGCRGDRTYYGDNSMCRNSPGGDVHGRIFFCECLDSSYEQIDGRCGASGTSLSLPVATESRKVLHELQLVAHTLVHGIMIYNIHHLASIWKR